ncbi:MAG: hypothetical protein AABY13_00790, partial [Nanoarchaeota archaeon]
MGKFSVGSVTKGLVRYALSPFKVWPAWAAALALTSPFFYAKYNQLTDDTHLKALHARAEPSMPVKSKDGRFEAREAFVGERRDIIIKDTSSGLERILSLPDSDETFPLFKEHDTIQFMSDKEKWEGLSSELYAELRKIIEDTKQQIGGEGGFPRAVNHLWKR